MGLERSAQFISDGGRKFEASGKWEGSVLSAPGFEMFPTSF